MKKLYFAAICSCVAVSTPSFAQSSVTLYGIIDTGLTFVNNVGGSHVYMMDDGISYGNRWGLKGREDLGGGNYAVFVLESGFKVDTGRLNQGGALFGRQAYVGVGNT